MNALLLNAPIEEKKNAKARSSISAARTSSMSAIPRLSVRGSVVVPVDAAVALAEDFDDSKEFDFEAERQQYIAPKPKTR